LFAPFGNTTLISDIECSVNTTGNFIDCSNALYAQNITEVRANCSAINVSIVNATFNLTNIPDSDTKFFANASSNVSEFWTYDNVDLFVNDSGDWQLFVSCTNSLGEVVSATESWAVPFGDLNASIITGNLTVNQSGVFTFESRVQCLGGECGNLNATLDPESNEGKKIETTQFCFTSCFDYDFTYGCGSFFDFDCEDECCNGAECDTFLGGFCYDSDADFIGDCFDFECEDCEFCGGSTPDPSPPDSDGDGVIDSEDKLTGGVSDVSTGGVSNLNVTIGGGFNNSPSGEQLVEFFDSGVRLFNFTFNFSANTLNLGGVNVTKTLKGIFVEGISGVNKTFFIPIGNSLGGVCVKNANGLITDTINCDGASERLITDAECDGTTPITVGSVNVTCGIVSGNYVVSGLTGSGGEPQSKGVIPEGSGTPFYTTNANPNSSCLGMQAGDICTVSWSVNATGNQSTVWKFFTIFSQNQYSGQATNSTSKSDPQQNLSS